jgi:quercetin dioxygenase-like cupin family protein
VEPTEELRPDGSASAATAGHVASSGHVVRSADRPVITREWPLPTIQRLVDAGTGSSALTVLRNDLSQGQQVTPHVHDVEEVLLIVDGTCTVRLGEDDEVQARAGDAVVVPPGCVHGFASPSGPASVIAVLASPDAARDRTN